LGLKGPIEKPRYKIHLKCYHSGEEMPRDSQIWGQSCQEPLWPSIIPSKPFLSLKITSITWNSGKINKAGRVGIKSRKLAEATDLLIRD